MPEEAKLKEQMLCNVCKKPILPDTICYQLRIGYIEDDGVTFIVDEDIGYYHQLCLVDLP